ncbi:MAG: hypothetical protein V9G13_10480 [Marmoricola sp.]
MGDVTSSQHTKGCNILFGVALGLLATAMEVVDQLCIGIINAAVENSTCAQSAP